MPIITYRWNWSQEQKLRAEGAEIRRKARTARRNGGYPLRYIEDLCVSPDKVVAHIDAYRRRNV